MGSGKGEGVKSRTVFTDGCFDLLHVGHIRLLQIARGFGDRLVVGVKSDRVVRELKGAGRPVVCLESRVEMLRAIRWVDDVRVLDDFTPCKLIDTLKPDVVVKGDDWISVSTAASITVFVQRTGPGTTGIIESIRRNFS